MLQRKNFQPQYNFPQISARVTIDQNIAGVRGGGGGEPKFTTTKTFSQYKLDIISLGIY